MSNYIFTKFLLLFSIPIFAVANPEDTVIIELGNNTRLVIIVDNEEELKNLENYDINAMLRDLNLAIDSSGSDIQQLVIEDETGEKYVFDTTIVVNETNRVSYDEDEDNVDEIRFGLGNYRITGKIRDWDEYEEEFEHWDDGPKFSKSSRTEEGPKSSSKFAFEFGVNNVLNDGKSLDSSLPYSVRSWGSWYVGLGGSHTNYVTPTVAFEWSGNITWYNFKLHNDQYFIQKGTDMVEFNPLPSEYSGLKSKLTASYINASFVPLFDFSRNKQKIKSYESRSIKIENYKKQGFKIGVGVYVGYRLHSHSKIKFRRNGDNDIAKEFSSLYVSNWRYGVRMRVGIKSLDLFFNYDLNELFNEGRGPELNAFSFGIIL